MTHAVTLKERIRNESAKHDEAVMNVLTKLQAEAFEFKSLPSGHVTFDEFIGR